MKFLSSDGLKIVLSKIKEMFYTKTEVDEKLKSVSGGAGLYTEGYFKTNSSKGLYCKVIETADKYEIWSNLKLSNSSRYTLNNLTTGKKFLGNAITFERNYSEWSKILDGYSSEVNVRFDFTSDGIVFTNITGAGLGATQHSGQENDFVFLGSVIKK